MIKAIIFDFWGTLVENGTYSPIRQVRNILRLNDIDFSDYVMALEKTMMLRRYAELKEAFIDVCNEFEIKPSEYQLNILIGLWNKNWLLAKPYPETIKVLEELKKSCKLILVSNTDNFSVEPVLKKFELSKYFDSILLSYQTGFLKTDRRMLENALSDAGISPDEAIVVGDSIESDIMPAQDSGIKAVLVDRKNRRPDFPDRVGSLEELKKFLQTE
ncbi:MAG: HAD family hydrolase [Candidatus Woesearchaeota archaeon]|nr:HAD family hydrolase [Candidatus Woesearchaeota archaeon]